jgi:hypothetical protein
MNPKEAAAADVSRIVEQGDFFYNMEQGYYCSMGRADAIGYLIRACQDETTMLYHLISQGDKWYTAYLAHLKKLARAYR